MVAQSRLRCGVLCVFKQLLWLTQSAKAEWVEREEILALNPHAVSSLSDSMQHSMLQRFTRLYDKYLVKDSGRYILHE